MIAAAAALRALGPRAVLVKGGHIEGAESIDVLDDGGEPLVLVAPRIATANTHGTGCTLSSAIAALLGRGLPLPRGGRAPPRPTSPRRSGRRISSRSVTATGRCIISTRSGGQAPGAERMTFSHEAWQRIAPLYAAILELPFNRELAAGTLVARAVHLLHAPGRALPDLVRPGARGHGGARARTPRR